MNNQPDLSTIEQKVQAAYQTIQPSPAFAARLRGKISAQAQPIKTLPRFFLSFRLALFGMTLILLLTAVLAIGPQTILAQAMSLLSFIPGVGFMDETTAVHLCQPVEVTQNGVTVKIDQAGGSVDELHIEGVVTYDREIPYIFELFDPQGNKAKQLNGTGTSEPGRDIFHHVYRLTSASRTWTLASPVPGHGVRVDLALCPGSQPSTSESLAKSLYTPRDVITTGKGITFQIQQVAQLNDLTGIEIETLFDPSGTGASADGTSHLYLFAENVDLTDDAGNHYTLRQQNMGEIGSSITSFEFDPISAEARRATLRIQQISFDDLTSVPFALDLGGTPQPGQTWDLKDRPGSEYQVNGYTISLLSASYTKIKERDYMLEFIARVTNPTTDFVPTSLKLEIGNQFYATSASPADGTIRLMASYKNPLTDQPVTGKIGWLSGDLKGPWEIQWDLPK